MCGVDNRGPARAQLIEEAHEHLLGGDIDTAERLVEQEHISALEQGAGEKDPLLLATRERADLDVRECVHANFRQRGRRPCPIVTRERAPARGAAADSQQDCLDHRDRKRPVRTRTLRDVGDARIRALQWRTVHRDRTVRCGEHACNHFQQGALSCPVRTTSTLSVSPAKTSIETSTSAGRCS